MKTTTKFEIYRTALAILIALLIGYLIILFVSVPKRNVQISNFSLQQIQGNGDNVIDKGETWKLTNIEIENFGSKQLSDLKLIFGGNDSVKPADSKKDITLYAESVDGKSTTALATTEEFQAMEYIFEAVADLKLQADSKEKSKLFESLKMNFKIIDSDDLNYTLTTSEKISEAFSTANNAFKIFLTAPVMRENVAETGNEFNFRGFVQWINESVPIIITGLAIAVVFSAKQFNIGAEGQMFMGAVVASFAAIYFPQIPILHPIVVILLAALTGAGWATVPAVMKSKLKASELVTSLMMNYVAVFLGLFIIKAFLRDPNAGQLVSFEYQPSSLIPLLNVEQRWHSGIIIALLLCAFFWFVMKKTTWGYKVRMVGKNQNFAYYSGINTSKTIFEVQVVSGAIAGTAGILELLGYHGRFLWLFSPGYGWDGIIIATLARNNPAFVPIAGLFLSYIRVGAKTMGRYTDIPPEIVSILQATIILLVTAEAFLATWKQKAVVKEAKQHELDVAKAGESNE